MAVTAKFVADFSQFNQAVDRAVGKLDTFKKGAEGAERALFAMVDKFSGQRLIREATLAAEAVEAIGGASKLTERELEQVGNTAKEAVEKMKLLGKDVPKNLEELAKHAKSSTKELGLMDQVLAKIGPAMLSAFSVGAVISFAKEIGAFAGRMKDLSAETQISTTKLQAWNYLAAGVGLTVEDVTGAVTQMSKRIAGGDDSAAAAIERLGLSIYQIQQLNPSDAFVQIGEAIAKIENPMERTRTAMELFGRSGGRMLRLMSDDMGKMLAEAERGGAIISAQLIDKADAFDDAWTQAILHVKAGLVGMVGAFASAFSGPAQNLQAGRAGVTLGSGFQDAKVGGAPAFTDQALLDAQNAAELAKMLGGMTGPKSPFGPGAGPQLPDPVALRRMVDGWTATEKAQAKAKATQDAWNEAVAQANEGMAFMIGRFGRDMPAAIEATAVSMELRLLPALEAVEQSQTRLAKLMKAMPGAIASQGASKGISMEPQGMFGAFGGGVTGGLQGLLKGFTDGNGINGLMNNLGGGIIKGFGQIISGGLSSAINAGIGLLSTGVQKLFGKLFGGEGKKVNDMRDQFIAAAGGIDVLAKKAQEAGTSVDRLLAAKKVKDFESAVLDLQNTMGEFAAQQEKDQIRLQAALEKYQFTLEELGPALQKQKLDEQATDLAEDWRVLMAAGVDVNAINERMEESIKAYLDAALSVGAEVPASMKPVLQSMLETGQLTDEAGNAFKSLDEAGITFASTLTDVVDRLDELIDKMEELRAFPSINVGVPGIPEGFARGTGGRFLDFGRGTPVMLHGRERVMTEGEGRSESAVVAAVNGLRSELVRTVRQVAMAGRDASLIAAGRTV